MSEYISFPHTDGCSHISGFGRFKVLFHTYRCLSSMNIYPSVFYSGDQGTSLDFGVMIVGKDPTVVVGYDVVQHQS